MSIDENRLLRARCEKLEEELAVANERIRLMAIALGAESPVPGALGLRPREAEILGMLLKRLWVKRTQIAGAITPTYHGDITSHAAISVHISNLRKRLKPFGIRIDRSYDKGYSLPKESRERIAALADGERLAA